MSLVISEALNYTPIIILVDGSLLSITGNVIEIPFELLFKAYDE